MNIHAPQYGIDQFNHPSLNGEFFTNTHVQIYLLITKYSFFCKLKIDLD